MLFKLINKLAVVTKVVLTKLTKLFVWLLRKIVSFSCTNRVNYKELRERIKKKNTNKI